VSSLRSPCVSLNESYAESVEKCSYLYAFCCTQTRWTRVKNKLIAYARELSIYGKISQSCSHLLRNDVHSERVWSSTTEWVLKLTGLLWLGNFKLLKPYRKKNALRTRDRFLRGVVSVTWGLKSLISLQTSLHMTQFFCCHVCCWPSCMISLANHLDDIQLKEQ
jgi:hypothetical protein